MKEIFVQLLNMSIVASWLIVAVVLFRFLFKKAPKWIVGLLWCMVGFRLICPLSFHSRFSLVPSQNTIVVEGNNVVVDSGISSVDDTLNAYLQQATHETETTVVSNSEKILTSQTVAILLYVWVAGICVLVFGSMFSYLRLKHRLKDATRYEDNIFQTEKIDSPFVFGILRPVIYIPYKLQAKQLECVIMHEKSHIKRKDYLIKPIGYILFAIYWFNPLVWIAYIMLCRDIELACDEKVIRELGYDKKKIYSQTLLECSIPQSMLLACPVAFAEVGVKERIVNVMKLKKTKKGIIVGAFAAVALVAIGFMTNPLSTSRKAEDATSQEKYQPAQEDTQENEIVSPVVEETAKPVEEQDEAKKEEGTITSEAANTSNAKDSEASEVKPATVSTEQESVSATASQDTQAVDAPEVKEQATQESESQEQAAAEAPAESQTEAVGDIIQCAPVMGYKIITRGFSGDHLAIDYAEAEGTPLVAAFSGTVTAAGFDSNNGNYIVITNGAGWSIYYNNCKDVSVSVGQNVGAGAVIGTLGSTGLSTGPHVHFALSNPSGSFVNPLDYSNVL